MPKLFDDIYEKGEFLKNHYINIINNNVNNPSDPYIEFPSVKLTKIDMNGSNSYPTLHFFSSSGKGYIIIHTDGVDYNYYTYEVVDQQQCEKGQNGWGCNISGGRVSKKQSRKRKSYRKRAGRKTHSR